MIHSWFKINEKLRFLILASFNMAIRYLIFVIIGIITGITHYQIVLACSWFLSVFVAFYSYKYLVFSSKGSHIQEFTKSLAIWILSYFLNVFLLTFLIEKLNFNAYVAQGIIICFIFVINYFLFKHFAFAKNA